MTHQIYTITDFEIVAPYTLHLTFNDGVEKTIDLYPVLRGELYGPLRDLDFFNKVELDREEGTIVWPNEADYDPATLHDWDELGAEMIEMAGTWEDVPQVVQPIRFDQILRLVHRLEPGEKIKLIRVLAQDLEGYSGEITPPDAFKTYYIQTRAFEKNAEKVLRESSAELEPDDKAQDPG